MKYLIEKIIGILIAFLVFSPLELIGQKDVDIDTASLIFTAKMEVLGDRDMLLNSQSFDSLMNAMSYNLLSSKGFENAIFIKISWRSNDFDSAGFQKQKLINNQVPGECDYIQAFIPNNVQFYKLKGFKNNQWLDFIKALHYFNSGLMLDIMLKEKAVFLGLFSIKELDLNCLYDVFYKKRSPNDCDCVISCDKRDEKASWTHGTPSGIFDKK